MPPGAWLIRHPEKETEHVHVIAYDERRPGTVFVTGDLDIDTGASYEY